ncbi:histidine kinase [Hymenobacter roseosalivarius DSM 11622]|uniref:histidine kinase n=1 Tax=Hymenobacter roseosalivarius DSM 11622 TaxID=645990 RepID=A0A1W1UU19_9BACT|nr:ATP-binding protein [Hymenobacter roseosalivarius]SMB84635.1 histidine kinase [Hymenobacter roseosalivarius DSM 11622]
MKFDGQIVISILLAVLMVRLLRRFFDLPKRLPQWDKLLTWIWVPGVGLGIIDLLFSFRNDQLDEVYMLFVFGVVILVLVAIQDYRPARTVLLAIVPYALYSALELVLALSEWKLGKNYEDAFDASQGFTVIWMITFILIARNQKRNLEKERLLREEEEQEKKRIAAQNVELERLVAERTATLTKQTEELRKALTELKTMQTQLIQAEKMASLGELTAGIAHEIQNPLNFVTNFSDVSAELITELEEEKRKPNRDANLETELLVDLKQNLQKITHHGQRAASIVKGMLEHSRASTGELQPTDINTLADEYLRLAYHGLRAKDKTFNATLYTNLYPELGQVNAIPQDIGRVMLNLFTNAFYAVQKKKECGADGYVPTVSVSTRRTETGDVEVRVRDNGMGMTAQVKEKIFQPFFTTKPTGEGTGLGLSLSYDIVTKGHKGLLTVESQEGEFTEFTIRIPS